jgi:hypothetical protein
MPYTAVDLTRAMHLAYGIESPSDSEATSNRDRTRSQRFASWAGRVASYLAFL